MNHVRIAGEKLKPIFYQIGLLFILAKIVEKNIAMNAGLEMEHTAPNANQQYFLFMI